MLSTYPSKNILRKKSCCLFVYSLTVFAALVIILVLSIQNTNAAEVTAAWNPNPKAYIAGDYNTSTDKIGWIADKTFVRLCHTISSAVNLKKWGNQLKSSMLFFKHKRIKAYKYNHDRYKTLKAITGWTFASVFYCLNNPKVLCFAGFVIATIFMFIRTIKISISREPGFAGRKEMAKYPALSARHFLLF